MTAPLTPQVSLRVYRQGKEEFVLAYLIRQPDGRIWAFPDDQSHAENPSLAGAIELDPRFLEQQPTPPGERPLYFYQVVLGRPQ